MTSNQETEDWLPLERVMHQYVWGPWSADHASRPDSEITQLAYDPERYPEQRFEVHKSEITTPSDYVPGWLLAFLIQRKLGRSFDSPEVARRMVDSFRDRPASQTDQTPLLEKLNELIENGETISMIDSHADFTGGVRLLTALSAALKKGKYLRRNTAMISKTMTREAIRGKSVARHVLPISSIIWVNPDTDSYQQLLKQQELDEKSLALVDRGSKTINAGAMRAFTEARKKGGIMQWAPFSSAVERITDPDGNLIKLQAPNLPDQAPGLLARTRYTLPVAYWPDKHAGQIKWLIGDLHDRDSIAVETKKIREGMYVERALGQLCTLLSEVSGVPVEHSGTVFSVHPHQIDAAPSLNL